MSALSRPLAWLLLLAVVAGACEDMPGSDETAEQAGQDDGGDVDPPPSSTPGHDPADEEGSDAVDAYAVSAGDPDAVEAGMQVLADGGNAVDAAVATAYAVSVVEPFASGIGGGGQAIVAGPDEAPQAYDYREVVPESGQIPSSDTGIPGFVAGMEALHDDHGDLERAEVLEPSIALAEGAETSGLLSEQLAAATGRLPTGHASHLFPDGQPLQAGAPLVQEELGDTLRRLADEGAGTFYEGAMAEELAGAIGEIDTASLAAYDVQRSEPPSGRLADYEVVGAAPPLPGSALVQMVQIAEAAGAGEAEPGSADFVHRAAMAWRAAEQHIQWDIGDPDFTDVPTDVHTDADRNAAIAGQIPADGLLEVDASQPRGGLDPNTTHLTVVDADGTMVSMTNTITSFWGSGQYALGFFLNNHLSRFAIGRGDANEPEPGRRSVTWSLPAMVLDDQGRPVLGLGTPGGRRIPMILTQVLARWALHGQGLEESVAAPRFHLEGSTLEFEEMPPPAVIDELRDRGYGIDQQGSLYFGSLQALEVDREAREIRGARDERREADWRVESR